MTRVRRQILRFGDQALGPRHKRGQHHFTIAPPMNSRSSIMRVIAALLCASWLGLGGPTRAAEDLPPIPNAWLGNKISVAEAEAANPGISDDRVRRFPEAAKPFGFQNRDWEAFKAAMKPGDEIWTFATPWHTRAGSVGIALVRDGSPVKVLTTTTYCEFCPSVSSSPRPLRIGIPIALK